jgi:hypothetical protein
MSNALVEALAGKKRKAERYANERGRFCVDSMSVTMRSEHGNRVLTFQNGQWSCTCEFFAQHETCSHVMALDIIFGESAGLRPFSQSGPSSQPRQD